MLRPLPGGDIADIDRLVAEAARTGLPETTVRRLVYNYGTEYRTILGLGDADPKLLTPISEAGSVIGAEIVHAVRDEMALTLGDVVLRRTDLGSAGLPDDVGLRNTAVLMARELGWNDARVQGEVEALKALPNWPGPLDIA